MLCFPTTQNARLTVEMPQHSVKVVGLTMVVWKAVPAVLVVQKIVEVPHMQLIERVQVDGHIRTIVASSAIKSARIGMVDMSCWPCDVVSKKSSSE